MEIGLIDIPYNSHKKFVYDLLMIKGFMNSLFRLFYSLNHFINNYYYQNQTNVKKHMYFSGKLSN